jgi:hypothetical protein
MTRSERFMYSVDAAMKLVKSMADLHSHAPNNNTFHAEVDDMVSLLCREEAKLRVKRGSVAQITVAGVFIPSYTISKKRIKNAFEHTKNKQKEKHFIFDVSDGPVTKGRGRPSTQRDAAPMGSTSESKETTNFLSDPSPASPPMSFLGSAASINDNNRVSGQLLQKIHEANAEHNQETSSLMVITNSKETCSSVSNSCETSSPLSSTASAPSEKENQSLSTTFYSLRSKETCSSVSNSFTTSSLLSSTASAPSEKKNQSLSTSFYLLRNWLEVSTIYNSGRVGRLSQKCFYISIIHSLQQQGNLPDGVTIERLLTTARFGRNESRSLDVNDAQDVHNCRNALRSLLPRVLVLVYSGACVKRYSLTHI